MIELLFVVLYLLYYIFIFSSFIYFSILISLKVYQFCGWSVFGIEPSVIEENDIGLFVAIVFLVALYFVVLGISDKINLIKKTRKKMENQEQFDSIKSIQILKKTTDVSEKVEKTVNDLGSYTSLSGSNESINDSEDELCEDCLTFLNNPFD